MTVRPAALALAGLLLLTGCKEARPPLAISTPSPTASPTASPTPSPTPVATPRRTPSPTPSPTHKKARPTPRPVVRRTAVAVVPTCPRVPAVRATQVLLVVGSGSTAVVRTCEKRHGTWVSVLGRMAGHVGMNGVAPPGAKREGDRRTPSGTFALGNGFGVLSDPGTWFSWHRTTTADVWVDDPGSSLYNTMQRKPANGRWDSAEDLYVPGNYDYVQVIGYNTARTPGKGSAIFLHVDHRSGTFGCVTLPRASLLRVLRWERPGAVIVIR